MEAWQNKGKGKGKEKPGMGKGKGKDNWGICTGKGLGVGKGAKNSGPAIIGAKHSGPYEGHDQRQPARHDHVIHGLVSQLAEAAADVAGTCSDIAVAANNLHVLAVSLGEALLWKDTSSSSGSNTGVQNQCPGGPRPRGSIGMETDTGTTTVPVYRPRAPAWRHRHGGTGSDHAPASGEPSDDESWGSWKPDPSKKTLVNDLGAQVDDTLDPSPTSPTYSEVGEALSGAAKDPYM